ncbi:myelin-associated glycoprotein-like [Polypterus senegalus]|uniref:myelin-associated glycoprotein-like n=1 Tax=Polypterus senegalus TaxID=55291 RepID=UPI0019644881|nr:myelin-associated glycoprotein-like [Polypterus senegalus]
MSTFGILIFLLSLFQCSCGQKFYATMPSNIQALTGSCLVIPCSFTSPQEGSDPMGIWRINHYWSRVDVFKGNQSLNNWSGLKVTILGDLKLRNCTTLLDGIGPDNQGVFYFRIEDTYLNQGKSFKYSFTDGVQINITGSPNRPLLIPRDPVMEGTITSLNCTAPLPCPNQPPSLMWSETLNGTVLWTVLTGINGSRSVLSLLTFTASYRDHQKNITCIAWYPVGSENRSAVASVTLSIWYFPKDTSIKTSDKILMGSSLTLTCNANANPAATYTWFEVSGTAVSMVGSEQNWTIKAVTPSDSGRYYCMAQNQYGAENSSAAIVDVLFPPTNTTARLNPTGDVRDGDQVALICNSSANPAANYTWFRANGAAISPTGSGQILTLTAVTPGDSGRYYCQAQNQYGEDNSSVTTLDVRFMPNNTNAILSPTGDIVEGAQVSLTCASSANPAANYSWFKVNGANVSLMASEQNLTFRAVTPSDSGRYYCKAQNWYGTKTSPVEVLDVHFPPFNTTAILNLTNQIMEGDWAALTCNSSANPTANYSWFKMNGTAGSLMASQQELIIEAVTPIDSGGYYCEARNSLGKQNSTVVSLEVIKHMEKKPQICFVVLGAATSGLVALLGVLCLILYIKRRRQSNRTAGGGSDVKTTKKDEGIPPMDEDTVVYVNSQAIRDQMKEHEGPNENLEYACLEFSKEKSMEKTDKGTVRDPVIRGSSEHETVYSGVKYTENTKK